VQSTPDVEEVRVSATSAHEQALRRLGPVGVAALLERLPQLVAAMRGDEPPTASGLAQPRLLHTDASSLARVLAQPHFVIERLRWLDRFTFQLAALALWHGGSLRREDAVEAAGPELADELEAAGDRIVAHALAERETAWLALLPGVAQWLGTPGIPVRDYANQLRTDDLAVLLRNLGVTEVAPRKAERVDQLEAVLRDPGVVDRAIDELTEPMRQLLEALISGGMVSLDELLDTDDALLGALYGNFPVAPRAHRSYGGERTPLHELTERGLLVVDPYNDLVFVPLDVRITLQGGLFTSWPVTPDVQTAPLADVTAGHPAVLGLLDGLLRRLERDPVDGLKSGGIGVRVIRTLAGQLGLSPAETAVLTHLAVELDLLGSIETSRGTATRAPSTIWTTTANADDLHEIAPLRRWALLVLAWLDSPALADDAGLPEKVEVGFNRSGGDPDARRALLEALASLPEGHGVTLDKLVTLSDHAHPTVEVATGVEGRVAAMRLLGLVPPDGPIGLTTLGRVLLVEGPDAAARAVPEAPTTFTVQPDHSVIAPPGLEPDIAARLERYAVRESSAGASVYRLSATRIAEAFDVGESGDDVLAFLAEHSTAALPQNVEVLVGDVVRRHGRVKVGTAVSYVIADDPVLIAEAVALKAAKLRQLAPTVAVSSLSRGKLLLTLAAKGMMPVADGADGAAISSRRVAEPEVHTPGPPVPPAGGLLGTGPPDPSLLDLAHELLHTSPTDTSTSERERR
jgi:hypothetical protein